MAPARFYRQGFKRRRSSAPAHEGVAQKESTRNNRRTPGAGVCTHCKGANVCSACKGATCEKCQLTGRCAKCFFTGQRIYDSREEAKYSWWLDARARAGELTYRCQVPIKCIANGKLICTRKIDFYVEFPDGHIELQEVKGYREEAFKVRQNALEATWLFEHPEARYVELRV